MSALAAYSTSSSDRRDENGSASVDAATLSVTGKSPGRKSNRFGYRGWRWRAGGRAEPERLAPRDAG